MTGEAGAFKATTLRYIRKGPTLTGAKGDFYRWAAKWALTVPFQSRAGGARLMGGSLPSLPACWHEELAGKSVLIVGSGPSLDRADRDFLAAFDARIYINFALLSRLDIGAEYFFSTDLGPIRQYLDAHGEETFRAFGKDRTIWAPVFLDQVAMLTDAGYDLLTILRPHAANWQIRRMSIGKIRLPLIARYYPVQPDWTSWRLGTDPRILPILDHTSALSAILFAAQNGARTIGMIGCDFSSGRARAAASTVQETPDANVFSGAVGEFHGIRDMLTRHGIDLTNHSWEPGPLAYPLRPPASFRSAT